MSRLNVVFMGSPAFARPSLQALHDAGHRLSQVFCQRPKPAGRGQALHPCPVHALADALDIPVSTPKTLRKDAQDHINALAALAPDVIVVVAYGLILPQAVLDIPRLGCVNVHFSLLPRGRGAAPVQYAIGEGDAQTGICLMRMDAGLDTGPVYRREAIDIPPDATCGKLLEELGEMGARMLPPLLDDLDAGRVQAVPQPEEGVTLAPRLERADGQIDWRKPACVLERQMRAFDPWPGAFFAWRGENIKLLAARVDAPTDASPGTLLDSQGRIACGDGTSLCLLRLQRPGRAPMNAADCLRGMKPEAGESWMISK